MHYTDDDLVLHYYGEARRKGRRIDRHLQRCARCADAFAGLARSLDAIERPSVPERSDRYGLEVWQRIRAELSLQDAPPSWRSWARRLAVMASAAVLVAAAFVGGRHFRSVSAAPPDPSGRANASSRPGGPSALSGPASPSGSAFASDSPADRARLDAIADHLERAERMLLDLTNTPGGSVRIAREQAWASDMVAANRLYRDAAVQAGDQNVAAVLDALERSLLDIVHEPSTLTRDQLDRLVARLDSATLLFKVRVLADELRDREASEPAPGPIARKTT